jgi:hypothetical protein
VRLTPLPSARDLVLRALDDSDPAIRLAAAGTLLGRALRER